MISSNNPPDNTIFLISLMKDLSFFYSLKNSEEVLENLKKNYESVSNEQLDKTCIYAFFNSFDQGEISARARAISHIVVPEKSINLVSFLDEKSNEIIVMPEIIFHKILNFSKNQNTINIIEDQSFSINTKIEFFSYKFTKDDMAYLCRNSSLSNPIHILKSFYFLLEKDVDIVLYNSEGSRYSREEAVEILESYILFLMFNYITKKRF